MNLYDLGWNHFFFQYFENYTDQNLIPARVTCVQRNLLTIFNETGELKAELAGKFLRDTVGRADRPVVGDWVAIKPHPAEEKATIQAILPRKSHFSRKVPGEHHTVEQIIAANIDTAFLVVGLDGEFNLRRIERYITLIWDSGATPVVILNKTDVCPDVEKRIEDVESVAFGIPVHPISAAAGTGVDILKQYLSQKETVVLLGSSGVGKSTLINQLLNREQQVVQAVHAKEGEGRHTTTFRELFFLPSGGAIIDNPGMRELQLWADETVLQSSFEDIEAFAEDCKFRDCLHQTEPGCAVLEALEDSKLDRKRYQNYLKQRRELRYLAGKRDSRLRIEEKKQGKKLSKMIRDLDKKRNP